MSEIKLQSILESVLGAGKSTNKGNIAFFCPICQSSKRKLEIQTVTNEKGENPWHCWVCSAAGKKLTSLFKALNVDRNKLTDLYKILNGNTKYSIGKNDSIRLNTQAVELPKQYIPLYKSSNSTEYKNALHYLRNKRKLSLSEIVKYNIGYCEEGEYAKKIIIPSYDSNSKLNYFVGRAYYESDSYKHKNPAVSKDIIPLELFINWSLPIVICEGMFDAIAIRRNAIPLLGKTIPNLLKQKIITERVQDIYLALDRDAQKQALDHAEYFLRAGKNVYLVDLNEKDPGDIGFAKMSELIKSARKITDLDLITIKLT